VLYPGVVLDLHKGIDLWAAPKRNGLLNNNDNKKCDIICIELTQQKYTLDSVCIHIISLCMLKVQTLLRLRVSTQNDLY
jgi:hypothetical protein